MIPPSPLFALSTHPSSPTQFPLAPVDLAVVPSSPLRLILAAARTSVRRALGAWKSITSSQDCLNFQLTTLRSVSPDTSITSHQPSKHRIRLRTTKTFVLIQYVEMPHCWTAEILFLKLHYKYFTQTLDESSSNSSNMRYFMSFGFVLINHVSSEDAVINRPRSEQQSSRGTGTISSYREPDIFSSEVIRDLLSPSRLKQLQIHGNVAVRLLDA